MNLLILAAGKSSRIYKKIKKHKCLIRINKKTLISKIIDDANSLGIKNIYVVIGFDKEKIKKQLKNKKINFILNQEYKAKDMLYSMFVGLNKMKDDTIVCYSDIIFDKDVFKLLALNRNEEIILPILKNWKKVWKLRNKDYFEDAETLNFNYNNYLTEIGNKIKNLSEVKGQYMGIIYFKKKIIPKILNEFKKIKNNNKMHITTFLNKILKNYKIKCKIFNKLWFEFDDIEDLNKFNSKIKTRLEI
ncbi:NTP transferase domain-containing protein [Candidatus Pelagibacter ubique]|nr:NTP transferase domain-containing protein [Candidatus Pelagibacter ubique]